MITKEIKAVALAKIIGNVPIEEVAEELELPVALVREWQRDMTGQELVKMNANLNAIKSIANGEIVDLTISVDQIDAMLKQAAVELIPLVVEAAQFSDLVKAQSIQVCAVTLAGLYKSFVEPERMRMGNSLEGASLTEDLLMD